jgi:ABC-type thiamine transport system ATPase subunit
VARSKRVREDFNAIANDFRCFRKSGLLLSSHRKRMINQYPEQWIAVYDGKVAAHGDNYDSVLAEVDSKRIPRSLTLVRYITKKPKSMIL